MSAAPAAGRTQRALGAILGALGALALLGLMVNVGLDVLLRYTMNAPVPQTNELVQHWWMVGVVASGLVVAARAGAHAQVTLLFDHLPPAGQRAAAGIGTVVSVVVLTGIAAFGLQSAIGYAQVGEVAMGRGLPIWPSRFAIPLAAALWALLILLPRGRRRPHSDVDGDGR